MPTLERVMTHDFDKDYWQDHWSGREAERGQGGETSGPHPFLEEQLAGLEPGTALEAGCGEGAEALWLAARGWQVTAVDIAADVLRRAADHASRSTVGERVAWVEADLSTWEPGRRFDLVTSHYAHASIPQLDLYDRLASWVAPGGTLLLVGHLHTAGSEADHRDSHHDSHHDSHRDSHRDGHPPEHATVTADDVSARLDPDAWRLVTSHEGARTVRDGTGRPVTLHDVVITATRR